MSTKLFLNNYLTFLLVMCLSLANAQSNCKEIKATIEVFQAGQKEDKGLVTIDFHGQSRYSFEVSIIGTRGYFKKDIQENEIKEIEKGTYTLVFTSRKEEDNFCIKHFEFIIK